MSGEGSRAAQCGLVLLFWLLVPTVDQVTAIIMIMMMMIVMIMMIMMVMMMLKMTTIASGRNYLFPEKI